MLSDLLPSKPLTYNPAKNKNLRNASKKLSYFPFLFQPSSLWLKEILEYMDNWCIFKIQMNILNYQILQHSFYYILINFFASTV